MDGMTDDEPSTPVRGAEPPAHRAARRDRRVLRLQLGRLRRHQGALAQRHGQDDRELGHGARADGRLPRQQHPVLARATTRWCSPTSITRRSPRSSAPRTTVWMHRTGSTKTFSGDSWAGGEHGIHILGLDHFLIFNNNSVTAAQHAARSRSRCSSTSATKTDQGDEDLVVHRQPGPERTGHGRRPAPVERQHDRRLLDQGALHEVDASGTRAADLTWRPAIFRLHREARHPVRPAAEVASPGRPASEPRLKRGSPMKNPTRLCLPLSLPSFVSACSSSDPPCRRRPAAAQQAPSRSPSSRSAATGHDHHRERGQRLRVLEHDHAPARDGQADDEPQFDWSARHARTSSATRSRGRDLNTCLGCMSVELSSSDLQTALNADEL